MVSVGSAAWPSTATAMPSSLPSTKTAVSNVIVSMPPSPDWISSRISPNSMSALTDITSTPSPEYVIPSTELSCAPAVKPKTNSAASRGDAMITLNE
ncbi:MAG: hypothetical protein J4G04_07990 [Nitrosopumilaceae archaeon]|nr:hypothetical protein [Nitrosopumilaceae archaeon]